MVVFLLVFAGVLGLIAFGGFKASKALKKQQIKEYKKLIAEADTELGQSK